MEIIVFIFIFILLCLGFLGSILPVLPGPPFSFIALLLHHFFIDNMNVVVLIWIGIFVLCISILDYLLQIYGVKRLGGGKYAIRGSILGMLLGLVIFPGCGILLGAFIGAYIGAEIAKDKSPLIIAFGALWGFIAGAFLKLSMNFYILYILFFS